MGDERLPTHPVDDVAAGAASGATLGGIIASSAAPALTMAVGGATVAASAATGGIAAGAAIFGGAIIGVYKCFRSGQHEYISAYQPRPRDEHGKVWIIATEEGVGNVRVCRYGSEQEAREALGRIWCALVLYNPHGDEVTSNGHGFACSTIRRVMRDHYFQQIQREQVAQRRGWLFSLEACCQRSGC